MLKAKNRLKLPASWKKEKPDFVVYSHLFKLIAKKIPGTSSPKVAFIISGKVGKATIRNRLRRKLTEAVSLKLESLELGLEIIFLLSTKAPVVSYEELKSEIDKALSKISLTRSRTTA